MIFFTIHKMPPFSLSCQATNGSIFCQLVYFFLLKTAATATITAPISSPHIRPRA